MHFTLTLRRSGTLKDTFIPWDTKMAPAPLIFVIETSLRYHSTQDYKHSQSGFPYFCSNLVKLDELRNIYNDSVGTLQG